MIIVRWSDNLLTAATVTTPSNSFEPGFPAANLANSDPRQPAVWRGGFLVEAGVNDAIDADGDTVHATLTPGWYYSPVEFAQEIARAMTDAAGADWLCWWLQGSTNRSRFVLGPATGSKALEVASGTNTASNALRLLAGFRNQDRTAAATHTGDYAARHSSALVVYDLGSAKTGDAAFIVGCNGSAGAVARVTVGAADPPAGDSYTFTGHHDGDLMAVFGIDSAAARYVSFALDDSYSTGQRLQTGGLWYGPVLDLQQWEWMSYRRKGEIIRSGSTGVTGRPFFSEMAPGESFTVAYQSAPGLTLADAEALESVLRAEGTHGLMFIALDPDNEPIRETRLCRIAETPIKRFAAGSAGRYSLTISGTIAEVA